MNETDQPPRSVRFSSSNEPRFWWHRLRQNDYVPPIYSDLTREEWQLIDEWYSETTRQELIGECAVPLMSLLQGFVLGSNIRRLVQLGTHSGYSTLLLGFFLRRSGAQHGLITFEIGEALCDYTRTWINRAGLNDYVRVEHCSSLHAAATTKAREYLGSPAQLVFIDSSHEYGSTASELDVWYPEVAPGGFIVLHDSSAFAASFDITQQGGVKRALAEWRRLHPGVESFSLNGDVRAMESPHLVYQDFCGAGFIQKPLHHD